MALNLHLLPSLRTPLPNPNPRSTHFLLLRAESLRRSSSPSSFSTTLSLGRSKRSARYAILGAGFAGLSVAWHLLKHSPKESQIRVDIFDENGIGGGASGVSGGLLHPYSPKAKLLWKGAECWKECLQLLNVAERVNEATGSNQIIQDFTSKFDGTIVCRRGILRPATSEKKVDILMENTQSSLHCCNLEALDREAAQSLVPGLCVPFDFAVYMPHAVNIHPKRYLQALFLACRNLADESSASNICEERELNLFRETIKSLRQLADEYDAMIICLGAKVDMLPELAGKLPLRSCRGVVAELQLPIDARGEYGDQSPSILSDAWLAFQGPRSVSLGSTWDWKSKDYTSNVPEEEARRAMEELLPKAAAVYPDIRRWAFAGARAGLRAMPPVTPHGSLPLLGSLNFMIREAGECLYWLVGGLGSRGLLYHGLAGNLTAQAVVSCDESVIPSEFTSWKKKREVLS
ncbi:uncharacterized protein LOC109712205 [Ananas comosus]|uniref:Uncharacterized protein LOC109712205 n=1 Tax=Ananas comosus TaxID=4615 RepID=A0A6P5F5H4_ANACO|nr:uncharacterized protein LOC109712205 [Ananas comosus]